jgi:predicted homoserine dehydrogenase-like protein
MALESGKHVVMVNVETDALLGKALATKAREKGLVYSLAYGDQPAILCEMVDWARTIGVEVVCAGKGTRYQPEYHYSTPDTVWEHFGISEEIRSKLNYNPKMYNSFLDGTKSAIEMCALANATGLLPQKRGLQFPPVGVPDLPEMLKPKSAGGILEHSGTVEVLSSENRDYTPIEQHLRWGVYVVFRVATDYMRRFFAEHGVLIDASGEYAAVYRVFHLIGLELGVSVASAALRGEPTGSYEALVADVVAVAKKDLDPGDVLDGEGGYTVFGRLVQAGDSISQRHLPIGLSSGARLVRPVTKDSILGYEDVELDEKQYAYTIRRAIESEFEDTR